MKNNIENNEELQIALDGFTQLLEEIKEAVLSKNEENKDDNSSALNADLLNKIAETIDNAKKAINEEDLKKFINVIIGVTTQLQEEANKVSAEFLNQKIEELREIAKQPSIVQNHYQIDFKSSKTFIAIVILCLGIGTSLYFNYNQSQENSRLKHNDIKYRYVQMKGGVSRDDIINLNGSYMTRPYFRDSIEHKIVEFETLVMQKAYNESVNEQNERNNRQINRKLKELTK